MAFVDKTLTCRECGATFTFSAGEQEFYKPRGLLNEPVRCPDCRSARRRGGSNYDSSSPRQMYPAVCASCGAPTEVPFVPRGIRPVYYSDCFAKSKEKN
ncbi:MAG: zinc-ribbon domain containing protein [Chloroflexi bacterium]|nr:zinc-ribbon domain containing protein [Chloroflexota bacterium]